MKKSIYFFTAVLSIFLVSCGPPESYSKAEQLLLVEKYDSAMYYFDRMLPEDGKWYDSSKVMKKKCLELMTTKHFWPMLGSSFKLYENDTALLNHGQKALISELKSIIDKDSMRLFYEICDTYKADFGNALGASIEYHEDKILFGHEWNGTKYLAGQRIIFTRESIDDSKGKNEGNKIQAKSNKSRNGWTKGNVIYRNLTYNKNGIYSMQPRVFKSGYYRNYQYFSNNGSFRIANKDTVIFNYGGSVGSGNREFFVRGDKVKPEVQ